ncbi:diacylglycerol kinase family protein [Leptolyngbya cf. ectocarpi LEGE 11479]|uniref:Diacylglycerol kinase family protein n=1 Tax=Leptolyngbya cf. ectocarpi LEGE 11479 TaxID=1828722 RepID=A0A928WZH2_LEPEC|nr:diacylglycerol kinase family protein [Leptolyngbya ectocarpi]MBE9066172.1 diacylglycerol kinase family protein [Leptolyngbya cf. ectocarpi LEGE 11479]
MSISSNLQTAPKSKKESKTAWQVAPNLLTSFRYAWAGIVYAVRTQRNFRIHLAIGLVALSLGIMLHIQALEAAVVAITVSAVLVIELINTALESVVDLTVGQTYHELAKIAKDCAAGAVLIAAMAALLVAAFIYLPPLFVLFNTGIS